MIRYLVLAISVAIAACGGAGTPEPKQAGTSSPNSRNDAVKTSQLGEYYSAVYALKGQRMPDDAKLAEQKREFANAFHINLKRVEGIASMNWDEKFREPHALKLGDQESVLVITFASAEGKPLATGFYEATDAADAIDSAPKDKPFAIITLIDPTGSKRLKGKINVSETGKIIFYSFNEKPAGPNLDSPTYGAPFKN